MKFNYELSGIGWADVEIEINNQKNYSTPSYISEPLIDLINALISITPGCIEEDELKNKVAFEWEEEPGGQTWDLERINTHELKVQITSYSDIHDKDKSNIQTDIETICNLDEFIQVVVEASRNILKKHGFVGYRKTWCGHDFPISGYLILKSYTETKQKYSVTNKFYRGTYDLVSSDLEVELKTLLG
jgi:hypothetical protein